MSQRELKRKRRFGYSSDEEDDGSYSNRISEEQYRAMLGEHIQKYKRRLKNSSPNPASMRTVVPVAKGSLGLKDQKLANDQRGGLYKLDSSSDFVNANHSLKSGNLHRSDFTTKYGADRCVSLV